MGQQDVLAVHTFSILSCHYVSEDWNFENSSSLVIMVIGRQTVIYCFKYISTTYYEGVNEVNRLVTKG